MKQLTLKRIEFRSSILMILITFGVTLFAVTEISGVTFSGSGVRKLEQGTSTQESKPPDVLDLKLGAPIERELAGGEGHSYRVILTAGQYLHVVVEQKGIDVVVRLFGQDGQKLTEGNNDRPPGSESIFILAGESGAYRVDVESSNKDAKTGTYEIRIEELREATSKDRVQVTAQRVFEEANQLRDRQTAESRRQAIKKYEEALPLFRDLVDRQYEANTLSEIGFIYLQLSENQKARENFGQALLLYRVVGDRRHEAIMLDSIGRTHWRTGEMQKALEYYDQGLSLSRAVKDRGEEAAVLGNMGLVYSQLGEPSRALEYFEQSLLLKREMGDRQEEAYTLVNIGNVYISLGELQKTLTYYGQGSLLLRLVGDRSGEGTVLNNIGFTYFRLGELRKALDYFDQSLSLRRAVGDRFGEAYTLDNMGKAYDRLSEPQKALQHYVQALEIRRAISDLSGQGTTLHNIGMIYVSLGEQHRALEYFDQSLSLKRKVGNRQEEAYTLDSIGGIYFSLGEFQKALDYHNQSLTLRRAVSDLYGEAATLANIGTVYDQLGELQKALEYFDQSLKLRRTIGDRAGEASTLHHIGSTYSKLRETDKALEYYAQALALSRAVGYQREEAAILVSAAHAERDRGHIAEARSQIESALNIIEATRAKVTSQDLRTTFLASNQNAYEFYVDLLMRLHQEQPSARHDVSAFVASERARARSLLDILAETHLDIRQGIDGDLLEHERSVQQQLDAKSERLTRLLSGKHTGEQEAAARKEVESLLTDYQDVEAQIRAKSPRYAALTQPQPLSAKEIQQLLDEDTILLEYSLGDQRSYLWAVTPGSIKSFELPRRAEIEAQARQVYDLVVSKADALHPEALVGLSQTLLGPVSDQLRQKKLIIVADGVLQYLPFGALPVLSGTRPRIRGRESGITGHDGTKYQPLILEHEVVSLPSASTMAALRRELSTRQTAPKRVLVFADPVFGKDDLRVRSGIKSQQPDGGIQDEKIGNVSQRSDIERSASDLNLTSFDRLPLSRSEAELITAMAPKSQTLMALDFAASRATATSSELGRYQIVHFATHSLLNNQHPELSGIVLSLVDEQGQPQDGFLRLHEIYNLKLEADLVVLSACQTALGKEIKGEGLVGLTRGFMYAGSPRVVASLWKVSDTATAELMKRFYQKMLRDGLRPAAALRAAQVSMLKEKQWTAPYYWAGFVLQGEWR